MLRGFWRGERSEDGQAVVIIAAVFTAMLMTVGLAIDAGQLYVARRTAQEAADAGAYAGAVVLYEGGSTTDATAAAKADITRNGFTDGGVGAATRVYVYGPPQTGPHASPSPDPHYVEVQITTQVQTSLLPQQAGITTVSVRGVAGAVPLNNSFAVMALDRGNTPNAIYVGPQGTVKATNAGILVNSTSATAANNNGGTVQINTSLTGTQVAGGVSGTWPTLTTSATQQPDPFAGYPKPSTAGLGLPISILPTPVGGVVTLVPGIYTVPISYAGNVKATLTTGTYILEAGMNGSGNMDFTNTAGGVFIFNTLTGYPSPGSGATCGGVQISGNAQGTSLSPLTTGPYQGLLFYQDPACTQSFTISGNGSLSVSGTIYLPTAQFVLNGNNAKLTGSQVVADTVNVQNGTLDVTFNTGSTAQPVLPRLAE